MKGGYDDDGSRNVMSFVKVRSLTFIKVIRLFVVIFTDTARDLSRLMRLVIFFDSDDVTCTFATGPIDITDIVSNSTIYGASHGQRGAACKSQRLSIKNSNLLL